MSEAKPKKSRLRRILLIVLVVGLIGGGIAGWWFYNAYYRPNVDLHGQRETYFYVRTGSTFDQMVQGLIDQHIIVNRSSFEEIAKLKKFTTPKPGRYRISNGMSNPALIDKLRIGDQEPVKVSFNLIRTKEQLASRIGKQLEADSVKLLGLLNDEEFLSNTYHLNGITIMTLFIPNTYEFNWNTSAEQFLKRMQDEYKAFWTSDRKAKAQKAGLSQSQVSVLASIVQSEQNNDNEEKRTIAGLYINRLNKSIPLQSDPTVIFAIGDFSIRRVLADDLKINSPYNTYLHTGLPPGPICMPEISSLDAVLNYQQSNYLYMCAEYGTGHHKFTADYNQHLRNAKAFQAALSAAHINR